MRPRYVERLRLSVATACVLVVFGAASASAAKPGFSGGEAMSTASSAASVAAPVASVRWSAGVGAVLPADASPKSTAFIESVSCPSAGNCGAVGFYVDSAGHSEGLLLAETAGRWTLGVEAVLPANAATDPSVRLNSISCASAGNCSAVGDYKAEDSSGFSEGLLLTETAGSWGTGVEAVLPADGATPIEGSSLVAVSCASAGNCSAVGSSFDGTGNFPGLLVTETAGTWAAGVDAPLPANAATSPYTESPLRAVSCASAGNCGAVGYYVDSSRTCQGLLLAETDGSWATGVEALPANAVGCAVTFAVSCPSAGNCSADLGDYLLTETAGNWPTVLKPVLPANACPVGPGPGQCDGNYGGSGSISCASAGNCTAVGDYTDSSGGDADLLLTETAGRWRAGVEAPRPANAAASDASLTSVSCAPTGYCSAVGQYGAGGLLLTKSAGKWTAARAALPANAAKDPDRYAYLYSVSCAFAGHCSAVGIYHDSSGNTQGLLLDSHPLPPCVVPMLEGKTLAAARHSLRSHACTLGKVNHAASQTIKKGFVISQKPKPGRRLQHGAKVNVVVSKGTR